MANRTRPTMLVALLLLSAGTIVASAWRARTWQGTTPDEGWSSQSSGVLAALTGVSFLDPERGWAIGRNGIVLATEDGGRTWTRQSLPTEMRQSRLRDLWILDQSRLLFLGEGSPPNSPAKGVSSFLVAQDIQSGDWRLHQFEKEKPAEEDERKREEPREPLLQRFFFYDRRLGWACGETGAIQATVDGGRTWTKQESGTRKLLYAIAAIDERQIWIVGAGGTLLRTVDGGARWREQTLPVKPTWRVIGFLDARRGWIAGGGSLWRTRDGGMRWEMIPAELPPDLNDLHFVDEREGWAVGPRGLLLHTLDGGQTWENVPLRTHANLNRLFFISPRRGWVAGANGVILHYHRDNL